MQTFLISWIMNGIHGLSTWIAQTEEQAVSEFLRHKPGACIVEIVA